MSGLLVKVMIKFSEMWKATFYELWTFFPDYVNNGLSYLLSNFFLVERPVDRVCDLPVKFSIMFFMDIIQIISGDNSWFERWLRATLRYEPCFLVPTLPAQNLALFRLFE